VTLVDTSVWVDHLRRGDAGLVALLERAAVVMHPFVVGELACGNLQDRASILELLQDLPAAAVASSDEALMFIERHGLHGRGIGYVDVHLLASVALMPGARLWTRDARLRKTADLLGCAHAESAH
jgi:predicted nucleic acid-binding protein